jgi:YVTN family beta-propeller protein
MSARLLARPLRTGLWLAAAVLACTAALACPAAAGAKAPARPAGPASQHKEDTERRPKEKAKPHPVRKVCRNHHEDRDLHDGGRGRGTRLPEWEPVTTVCVGKHPTDVAIAAERNAAVVANRDSRSLSLVSLDGIGGAPVPSEEISLGCFRPFRVAADGRLAVTVSPRQAQALFLDLESRERPRHVALPSGALDVALDADRGIAVVLHRNRRQLSVIRLAELAVVGQFALPHRADSLSYTKTYGWALVAGGRRSGFLSVIDVATRPAAPALRQTIALPLAAGQHAFHPSGVRVQEGPPDQAEGPAPQAVVFNKDGDLLVYDLSADLLRGPFPAGLHPARDAAGDALRSLAVLAGANDDALIVDLTAQRALYHVTAGRHPGGVAVSSAAVAIANRNDDSVSLFRLPDVQLRIVRLEPQEATAGDAFTLKVFGTGFRSGAAVIFDGVRLEAQWSTGSGLTVLTTAVPTDLVQIARTVPVAVAQGSTTTATVPFTIRPPRNPVPLVFPPLRPSNVVAGALRPGESLYVTIDGDRFVPSAQVVLDGEFLPAERVHWQSSTQIVVALAASPLAEPRTVAISVVNPPPGGGAASAPFEIKPPSAPPGVALGAVEVGAPTSGVAVDAGRDRAVVTHFGDITGTIGTTVSVLANLSQPLGETPPAVVATIPAGSNPASAAVDLTAGLAVVANQLGGTLSFLDLAASPPVELSPRATGSGLPSVVAVDSLTGVGLAAGVLDGSVDLFSTASRAVTQNLYPPSPPDGPAYGWTGVAIDPVLRLAALADEAGADGMYEVGQLVLFDLDTLGPVGESIPLGEWPGRVAVDATRHLALVTNQVSGSVSIVDLRQRREVARLEVGQEPFGVTVDESRGIALVTNRVDATLRFIDLKVSPARLLPTTVNLPFLPMEIAVVPGVPGGLRAITTDGQHTSITVIHIDDGVLP